LEKLERGLAQASAKPEILALSTLLVWQKMQLCPESRFEI
jgi:hypothetical protein